MDDLNSAYDFEHYQPREAVTIPTSRRGLFGAVMSEIKAYNDRVDGKPVLRIADLSALPDEEFAQIRPIRTAGCKISLREGMVWATPPAAVHPLALFPVEAPALTAFNRFNGTTPIQQVSQELAEKTGWPPSKCWAYTRGLVLKMVVLRVCEPH